MPDRFARETETDGEIAMYVNTLTSTHGAADMSHLFMVRRGEPIVINRNLRAHLRETKDTLSSRSSQWMMYKRYTNPHEFIGTVYHNTSVSALRPISRAFYKMVDIYNEFGLREKLPERIASLNLAEGPGGFIQALTWLRKNDADTYVGMSLRADPEDAARRVGPSGWFVGSDFLEKNPNVSVDYGATGTGDLTDIRNLSHVMERYGNSMDVVTGDGGFDFSDDYDSQESNMFRLLLSQVLFALSAQKQGGVFALKAFDMFQYYTVEIIYLLTMFYEKVHICKPLTSRVANSEKYVVCEGFKFKSSQNMFAAFIQLSTLIAADPPAGCPHVPVSSFLREPVPSSFVAQIEEVNTVLGQQQIENIHTTMSLTYSGARSKSTIDRIVSKHLDMCVQWCKKNGVPHNALKRNMFDRGGWETPGRRGSRSRMAAGGGGGGSRKTRGQNGRTRGRNGKYGFAHRRTMKAPASSDSPQFR
jgi:23S rRNA U2552 (ribose-2'-O)-methylase RlmE/FtsJ